MSYVPRRLRRPPRSSHTRAAAVALANRIARPIFNLEAIERRVLLASVAGTVFHDLDGDGVKDAGEGGLPDWTVFLDENQNGVFDGTSQSVPTANPNQPILDVRPPQLFPITVTGVGSISDLDVAITITHTWNADLDVFLISPAGTRVELFTDVGGSGDNIDVILDDEAPTSIGTVPTGTIVGRFRPEGSLADVDGENADGLWQLEITDDLAGIPAGTLNTWSLIISSGERSTLSSATGAVTFINVPAGTYDVRQVNMEGWNQTAPASGFYTVTLDAATNSTGNDFGNRQPPGTIRGTVFSDYDADGTKDPGEPGLEGWTVYLDLNDSGTIDAAEPTQTSGADGAYEFINLAPRQYVVREVLQAGYVQTVPGSGGVILDGEGEGNGGAGGGPGAAPGGDAADGRPFSQTEVVVAFKGNVGKGALKKQVQADRSIAQLVDYVPSRDMFTVGGVTLVEVKLRPGVDPQRVVEQFQSLGKVKWAQVNYVQAGDPRELVPNDPQYGAQYHHPLMRNDLAWDLTLGSPSILIGVTDNGTLLNHPDLAANIWVNPGEVAGNGIDDDSNGFIDDVNGWNFWNNNNDLSPVPSDGLAADHGTHVAGIIAARTNNGVGVAGTAGGATVVPLRFWGSTGNVWTSTMVASTYRYATDVGCHIVNTSYSVDGFANDMIFEAGLDYMYAGGVLHFNSAGNAGALNPPRQKWDQSLFVANTQSDDVRYFDSNYGWGIDISAPGTGIIAPSFGTGLDDPNYESKDGTSMAAPNAAGVAALIWSLHPTWTREQVAAQLLGSADNIDLQNPNLVGLLGAGRANAYRALTDTIAPPRIRGLAGLPDEGGTTLTKPTNFTLDLASVFDPATMNAGTFSITGAGIDGVFGSGDDTNIPVNVAFGGTNSSTYRIGTNRIFLSIPGSMGSDTYRFTFKSTAADPFGQALDGNGDGTGGDAFTRTFSITGLTNPYRVTVDAGEVVEDVNFGNHDRLAPKVLSSNFAYATAHQIVVGFSEDVSAALAIADVTLENLTAGTTVDTSGFTMSYDAATNTATISANAILADGNYRATFAAAGIGDPSNNALDGNGDGVGGDDFVMTFFFLQGDADHDGRVNLNDFNVLAANFGQTGTDFTEADFTYDGQTNLDDFNVLAARFGNTLPGAGGGDSAGRATDAPRNGAKKGGGIGSPSGSLGRTQIGVLKAPGQRQGMIVLLDDQTGRLVLA